MEVVKTENIRLVFDESDLNTHQISLAEKELEILVDQSKELTQLREENSRLHKDNLFVLNENADINLEKSNLKEEMEALRLGYNEVMGIEK